MSLLALRTREVEQKVWRCVRYGTAASECKAGSSHRRELALKAQMPVWSAMEWGMRQVVNFRVPLQVCAIDRHMAEYEAPSHDMRCSCISL